MQINYGNTMYNVVATKKDSNNLILMLQNKTGKMYQVEAKKIILYYYERKSYELLNKINDLSELIKNISNTNLILNTIPEYSLIKKIDPNFNIGQEDIKFIVNKTYNYFNKKNNVQQKIINSNVKQESNQNVSEVQSNSNVKKEENNIPFGNIPIERKNELSRMSSDELMFYLQMHPGENEELKEFIRYLIENKKEVNKISYVSNDDNNNINYQQNKALRKNLIKPNGYTLDIFITFFSGIVLGIFLMIIISLLIRL